MFFQCIKGIATKKKYYGYSDVIPQSEYENLTDKQKNNFVPVDEGIEDEPDDDLVNDALTENLYGQGEAPEDDSSSFQFPTPDPDPNQTSFDFGGGSSGGGGATGDY